MAGSNWLREIRWKVALVVALLLSGGGCGMACLEGERDALLGFKAGVVDPSGDVLSEWHGPDCCSWTGVHCDNRTGHVVRLRFSGLQGEISPSLIGLKHLRFLDLSYNNFSGSPFPKFLGSFRHLKHLDLSDTDFLAGYIPHELGNLSSLVYLDLSHRLYLSHFLDLDSGVLFIDDAGWLSGLSSLQFLSLDYVGLAGVTNVVHALNMLPSLKAVSLPGCLLDSLPQSLPHLNFTSLSFLDLSNNTFNSSPIPEWLFQIRSLRTLRMRLSDVGGAIPDSIGNATSLEHLDLSINFDMIGGLPGAFGRLCNLKEFFFGPALVTGYSLSREAFSGCVGNSLSVLSIERSLLTGPLPETLGNLTNLSVLKLPGNALNDPIPKSLWQLSQLTELDLWNNNFASVITETHLAELTRLASLNLGGNDLVLNVSPDWIPPFQLSHIDLSASPVGPEFPAWLRKQYNISTLIMSSAGISGSIPDWFWNLTFSMTRLDLSGNAISGKLPPRLHFRNETDEVFIYLSSNQLEGSLPLLPPSVAVLDLSNNSLGGAIPQDLADRMPGISSLILASNEFDGVIPSSICKLHLSSLDLHRNQLKGEIPDCLGFRATLGYINLGNNKLQGRIPKSIGSLHDLSILDLSNNRLHGQLPASLGNCTKLETLALAHNEFTGAIPDWIAELEQLRILNLRGNNFSGDLPQLSKLISLHVLDLSSNNFSGSIPPSYGYLTGMIEVDAIGGSVYTAYGDYFSVNMPLITKGRYYDSDNLLWNIKLMDLSTNDLRGHIPKELTRLVAMQALNLSNNHLTGEIPDGINLLRSLESLDLSRNNLTGPVPSSMAHLDNLGSLNLSYNDLTGKIPSEGHMNFIDPSIYAGNPNLCGFPLEKNCTTDPPTIQEHEEEESGAFWLCMGIIPGLVVGFWAVFGTLLLNKKWRYAYFRSADDIYDMIYVKIALTVAGLKMKFAEDGQR